MSKKFLSIFLSIAVTVWLLGGVVVMPIKAVTIEELQAQINALLAQIATLQAQLAAAQGQTPVGSLTKDLYRGLRDPEVSILQEGLKKDASVYPEGLVTGYFGPLTEAAVKRFQAKYGISQVGRVGPITRAKFNELYASAPSQPSQPSEPSEPSAVGTGLSVSLASDTPAAGTLVSGNQSGMGAQVLADVLKLNFSAGTDGAVKVKTLKLTRGGVSTDSDIANAYLVDGSNIVAEMTSLSNKVMTFTSSDKLFEIPAGSTKSIMVKLDLVDNTSAGKTITVALASASDVTTDGASVSGTFPITSNVFSTAQVGDLGKLTVTDVTQPTSLDPGVTATELWRFSMQSNNQKIEISKVKLAMVGTAPYDAFANLELRVDGVKVSGGSGTSLSSAGTITFDLSASPYVIDLGQTKNFALVGDVVKGSNRNFYFRITSSYDIMAKDMGYGIYVKPNQSTVYTIVYGGKTSGLPPTSINQGSVTIDKANDTPSGNVRLSATNILLGKFYYKATGEDIKISQLNVNLNKVSTSWTNVTNLKVLVDGVQVGTTQVTANAETDYSFNPGNTFIIPAGQTKYVYVYADLTGTGLDENDKVRVDLKQGSANALRMSTGTTFDAPGSDKSANALTITAGSLSTSKNPSVANMTVIKGSQDVVIGSWLITAPADQGVRVNTVTIIGRNSGDTANSAYGLGSAFDALRLFYAGAQVGQTINSPSTSSSTSQTFSLSSPIVVNAGQSVQVDLKANVLSNATWTDTDVIKVTEVSGTGVVTNSTVTDSTGAIAQQISTAAAGQLTVEIAAAPTNPYNQYFVAGDSSQVLGAWKFSANNTEDIKVTRIKLFATSTVSVGNLQNIQLFVDGSPIAIIAPALTPVSNDNAYALFENTTDGLFVIPKNSSKTLVVKASITDSTNATFNDDGSDIRLLLNMPTDGNINSTSDISAKGALSGQFVGTGGTAGNHQANIHRIVKTKPTLAYVGSNYVQTLVPGTVEVFRFSITAHPNEDVVFSSGTHNIRFTIVSNKSNLTGTGRAFNLYDATTNTTVASQVSVTPNSDQTVDFTTNLSITVAKGTSKTFYVKGNLADFTTTGDSFQLRLANTADDFSWSDNTSSADIEDDNYYGLGLPIDGPVFVKPGS